MTVVKPWEEVPDDGYWLALLGKKTERPPEQHIASVKPAPLASTAPKNGNENRNEAAIPSASPSLSGGGWALAEKS